MKFRVVYQERDGREHRDVIGAEHEAHARAVFKQAYPTARLTRIEPMKPSAPAAPRPLYATEPGEQPVSDEQRAALVGRAKQLTRELRTKLGPSAAKIRV